MNKHRATLFFRFLDETDRSSDDILLNDILNVILRPLIREKVNPTHLIGVFAMLSWAVDNMRDLIHLKPFYILIEW